MKIHVKDTKRASKNVFLSVGRSPSLSRFEFFETNEIKTRFNVSKQTYISVEKSASNCTKK